MCGWMSTLSIFTILGELSLFRQVVLCAKLVDFYFFYEDVSEGGSSEESKDFKEWKIIFCTTSSFCT